MAKTAPMALYRASTVCAALCLLPACSFDWDKLDPREGSGGGALNTGGSGDGGGGDGGAGGAGGSNTGGAGGSCAPIELTAVSTIQGESDLDVDILEVTTEGGIDVGGGMEGTITFAGVDHTAVGQLDAFVARVDRLDQRREQ